MTCGIELTPTFLLNFLTASNPSKLTSSKKNFGKTALPALNPSFLIPKKQTMTMIFKPKSWPTKQIKGYKRNSTIARMGPPASKATSMK
ncbi:hypothetical protein V2J09_020160 [Rumex salicifolius]